jgi:hypothetical protein
MRRSVVDQRPTRKGACENKEEKEMITKGKGASAENTDALSGKEANKVIIPAHVGVVQRVPDAPRLKTRFWEAPRNINSSIARVKSHISHWKKVTEETAYLVGKEFIWMRNTRRDHGGFMDAVAQTGVHIRTAQRLMLHARQCDEVNRFLPYHPNKRRGDTVSLLEPAFDQDELEEEKPKHEAGASKEWNATDCAKNLLSRYERLVMHRTEEDRRDVRTAFNEMADDSDKEFVESKEMIRSSGRMIEDEE